MELMINRRKYTITPNDRFMDNGKVIQLLTQSQEKSNYGHRTHPVLSKKLAKQFMKNDMDFYDSDYGDHVKIFGIKEA